MSEPIGSNIDGVILREASSRNAVAIADLISQLGYSRQAAENGGTVGPNL
jgi:hypothetical protein